MTTLEPSEQRWKVLLATTIVLTTLLRLARLGVPDEIYFDEVHYVNGARDYINGVEDRVWSHPPFGKMLMAASLYLLGDHPFAWRFTGLASSTITLLFTALTARAFWDSWRPAAFGTILVSLDFLSCAQARIATVDSIQTMWITGSLCACAWALRPNANFWTRQLIAALLLGFATACKWNGLFAAAAAAIVVLLQTKSFRRFIGTSILYGVCIAVIYVLCYLPFFQLNVGGLLKLRNYHETMYRYRQGTGKHKPRVHPFQSRFYTWPFVIRPVYYFFRVKEERVRCAVAIGNPLFWWMAFLVVGSVLLNADSRAKSSTKFFVTTILIQWLVWGLAGTDGFLYYMLPVVPQMSLLVAEELNCWWTDESRLLVFGYLTVLLISFAIYFPTLTCWEVPQKYQALLYYPPAWRCELPTAAGK